MEDERKDGAAVLPFAPRKPKAAVRPPPGPGTPANDSEANVYELTPDTVLQLAIGAFASVALVGFRHDGSLEVRSDCGAHETNSLLDLGKYELLSAMVTTDGS